MRAVLQRVTRGSVTVDGEVTGLIGAGWVILLGVRAGDTVETAERLADRVAHLRGFDDGTGRMNRSVVEVGGGALVVSQITLYADATQGRRPSFTGAAPPAEAEPLVEGFCAALRARGVPVETGQFGAHMMVDIANDGPVTFILDA